MPEQEPYEPERAIAGTGMGGTMDLGASEAVTLEQPPGPDGPTPGTNPAACGPTPGTTCAATPSSSSRRW